VGSTIWYVSLPHTALRLSKVPATLMPPSIAENSADTTVSYWRGPAGRVQVIPRLIAKLFCMSVILIEVFWIKLCSYATLDMGAPRHSYFIRLYCNLVSMVHPGRGSTRLALRGNPWHAECLMESGWEVDALRLDSHNNKHSKDTPQVSDTGIVSPNWIDSVLDNDVVRCYLRNIDFLWWRQQSLP